MTLRPLESAASNPTGRPPRDRRRLRLLRTSRASNAERDITGLLLHRKGRRTQFLEGDEAEVRALRELTLWFRVRAARPGTPPGNS